MQSIERYGVVALCFLIVTVVAVWLWDDRVAPAGVELAQASEAGTVTQEQKKQARGETPRTTQQKGVTSGTPRAQRRNRVASGLRTADKRTVEKEGVIAGSTGVGTGALTPERARARKRALAQAEIERKRAEDEERQRWEREQRQRALAEAPQTAQASGAIQNPSSEAQKTGSFRKTQSDALKHARRAVSASFPSTSSTSIASSGGLRPYVIRPKDTLSEIAMRELGTMKRWSEITAANPGLNAKNLPVGVEIFLPSGMSSNESRNESRGQSKSTKGWTVASGDSLWTIAQRQLGDGERWREIERLNPSIDPQRLRVGEVLLLPSGKSVPQSRRSVPKVANRDEQRSRGRGKVL